HPLAGRIAAVLDVVTRLPSQLWYVADETASDQGFWLSVVSQLKANCLLLFDSGFLNFTVFDQLTCDEHWFITRPRVNTVYKIETILRQSAQVHDYLITLGCASYACPSTMRL